MEEILIKLKKHWICFIHIVYYRWKNASLALNDVLFKHSGPETETSTVQSFRKKKSANLGICTTWGTGHEAKSCKRNNFDVVCFTSRFWDGAKKMTSYPFFYEGLEGQVAEGPTSSDAMNFFVWCFWMKQTFPPSKPSLSALGRSP